jgi:hypothetical protein
LGALHLHLDRHSLARLIIVDESRDRSGFGDVRPLAEVMILISLTLAYYVSLYWYLLTAFLGLNLLQSAFTS